MADADDGTTEFRAGSLRELLDEGEKVKAPKGGGAGPNRQLIFGAAAAAVVLVVVLVVVLGGGGGGDDGQKVADDGNTAFPVNVRESILTGAVVKGARVSICGKDSEPLAENVLIANKSEGQEIAGLAKLVKLEVQSTPEEQAKLAAYRQRTGEITVFSQPACPSAAPVTTASTAPAETTTQPPASTPPPSG